MEYKAKNILLVFLSFCIIMIFSFSVSVTGTTYRNYIYNFRGEAVSAPQSYIFYASIDSDDIGIADLDSPRDFLVTSDDQVYLLDTGNNRVLHLNSDFELIEKIEEFTNGQGKKDTFNKPTGLDIDQNGYIYIADQNNGRIVVLNKDNEYHKEIGPPETDNGIIDDEFSYYPRKITVDPAGNLYVIAKEVYDGILRFDRTGDFRGFIGAPEVNQDFWEYVHRRFLVTEQQRGRMNLYLPIEYSNLQSDEKGFIYATVAAGGVEENERIRRLNSAGEDKLLRRGFHPPMGDLRVPVRDSGAGEYTFSRSAFVDIVSRESGIYSALDRRRGRIFTYDRDGHLLYVFGGSGSQKGVFRNPVAIDMFSHKMIAVLDQREDKITLFSPTENMFLIHQAITAYQSGYYQESEELWKKVLHRNANYDLAYTGVGRSYLNQNEYEKAMENFRRGENRDRYSTAFSYYRRRVINDHFGLIMGFILILIIVLIVIKKTGLMNFKHQLSPEQKLNDFVNKDEKSRGLKNRLLIFAARLKYSLYLIFHPAAGFWELKHEKKGSLPAAIMGLFLICCAYVFMLQYTGFIFNYRDLSELNILREFFNILIPVGLWSLVNWALTTLMEGKGTLKEIFIATVYSFTPVVIFFLPLTVISNFLLIKEGTFYYFIFYLALIWSIVLLIMSTMVTHEYTLSKTLLTIISIVAGMGISLFLILLFFDQTAQVYEFARNIYTEIVFRR
ncbi:MAG: YIP1 family protein [Halanaerobiaceae bacterium]